MKVKQAFYLIGLYEALSSVLAWLETSVAQVVELFCLFMLSKIDSLLADRHSKVIGRGVIITVSSAVLIM